MKKKLAILLSFAFALALSIPMLAFAAGGSFDAGASTSTVNPGGTFTVSTNGQSTGKVLVNVNNGTASTGAFWHENGGSFTVTAGQSGVVTVTLTPVTGFSHPDGTMYDAGSRTVTVTINTPSTDDSGSGGSSTPSTPSNPSTPSTGGSGSSAAVTAPETEAEADKAETEEPKEDAKEEVKTEEVVVAEQEGEEDTDCNWHWIILIAALLATVLAAILKQKALKWAMVALYAVVAVICIVLGGCNLCLIIAIVGLIMTCIFPIIAMLKKAEND